ncbi:MAG: Crp/Fnr family transcriptional regulator [Candidatus Altimarinota bacterium]
MLEGIELFSSLNQDSLNTLAMFCQQRRVASGEVLFRKGEESTSMYIVISGKLEVFDGERVLGFVKSGEFVGEMSLFSEPKVRTASVKALEDTNVIVLLAFSIDQLGDKHPEILEQIRKVIEERKKKNQNIG